MNIDPTRSIRVPNIGLGQLQTHLYLDIFVPKHADWLVLVMDMNRRRTSK